MKSLKILTLVLTIITTFALTTKANASEVSKAKAAQMSKIQNVMDRAVDFPQEAVELGITGTVKAQVEVTLDGTIVVEEINGHPELRDYVAKQLKNVSINDMSLTGQTFIAKFDFRN